MISSQIISYDRSEVVLKSDGKQATYNRWANGLIGQIRRDGETWARYYYLKDHLGNIKVTLDQSAKIKAYTDYMPFGAVMEGRSHNIGLSDTRYKFTGKERDVETGLDYFGARSYDSRVGRWLSIDPMITSHPDYTPYAYVYNNPVNLTDEWGLDSTQRAQAIKKADDYVKKNPGDSYPTPGESKAGEFKSEPGGKVDCAGMVNGCVVAGGEKSIYDKGKDSGVGNVMAVSVKIGESTNDLSKAQTGNIVTLNNSKDLPLDQKRNFRHVGMVTNIEIGADGKVRNAVITHSSGTPGSGRSGPRVDYLIKDGNILYWGQRVTGIWKWDKKPD